MPAMKKETELMNVKDIPTRPKRTQCNAANMGKGIDAKRAPNFPASRKIRLELHTRDDGNVILNIKPT